MTYRIMGNHQGSIEEIDSTNNYKDACFLANEYRMAFGIGWQIWVEENESKN